MHERYFLKLLNVNTTVWLHVEDHLDLFLMAHTCVSFHLACKQYKPMQRYMHDIRGMTRSNFQVGYTKRKGSELTMYLVFFSSNSLIHWTHVFAILIGECLPPLGANPLLAERAFHVSDYWGLTRVSDVQWI